MQLPEATGALLARCTFPAEGTELACAVSGGADSLTLLALAVASGCRATAYHVDHHLRAGSNLEARLVEVAAARLGAFFVALEVQVPAGSNLEARARALRYGVLPHPVATGHTADDQAETVLLNLLRGSGVSGLAGMAPGPAHPLLALRRAETAAYAAALGLGVVDDASNRDPRFGRNRVRSELVPLCSEIAGRDVVPILARQAGLLGEEAALLDGLARELDVTDAAALRERPLALQRRALRRWIAARSPGGYPPDADAIARVIEVVAGRAVAAEVAGGLRVRRSRGRLALEPAGPRAGSKAEPGGD